MSELNKNKDIKTYIETLRKTMTDIEILKKYLMTRHELTEQDIKIASLGDIPLPKIIAILEEIDYFQLKSFGIWENTNINSVMISLDFQQVYHLMSSGYGKKYFIADADFFKAIENAGLEIECWVVDSKKNGVRLQKAGSPRMFIKQRRWERYTKEGIRGKGKGVN